MLTRRDILKRLESRNRDIFAAFQDGWILEDLAQLHQLSPTTVRQIVDREKLKRAVSPVAYYRALRMTAAQAKST